MGEEQETGFGFFFPPSSLSGGLCAGQSKVLRRLQKKEKTDLEWRGDYESVLDDDHDEWLTLSSKNTPKVPPQTHLQLLILHPVQRAVTRRRVSTGEQLHCRAAEQQHGGADNEPLWEQYIWICVLSSLALRMTLKNST